MWGEDARLLVADTEFGFVPFSLLSPAKQYHLTYTFLRVNSSTSLIAKPSLDMKTSVISSEKYQTSR